MKRIVVTSAAVSLHRGNTEAVRNAFDGENNAFFLSYRANAGDSIFSPNHTVSGDVIPEGRCHNREVMFPRSQRMPLFNQSDPEHDNAASSYWQKTWKIASPSNFLVPCHVEVYR